MSDTIKVTHLRAAYEAKYVQAKELGQLNDPEIRKNLEKINDMLVFLELPGWNTDSDNFESGAFLDEWRRRYEIAEKAGVSMESWQDILDKFEKSLDEIGRDLDKIEEDLREIEEETARCREQDSDVEIAEDYDSNDGETTADDHSEGTISVSDATYEPALSSKESQQASTSTSSESGPAPTITLDSLSHQTHLLREAFVKSPCTFHTNYDMACTTLCMLETYNVRTPLLAATSLDSVLSISTNLDEAQTALEILRMPETYVFSTVMEYLSRAFGKLLDNLFESASEAEPGQSDDQSDIQTDCLCSLSYNTQIQVGGKRCSADRQLGGAQMHSMKYIDSTVDKDESPGIRGGASDSDCNPNDGFENLADEFESLYDRVLRHTAHAAEEEELPPCTDAWIKLANILQLRNSTLEQEVKDLQSTIASLQLRSSTLEHEVLDSQDTNASLLEDVKWHVDAMAELEDALKEAQIESSVALKEVLDLDAQLSCAQNGAGSAAAPSVELSNGEIAKANASDSGSNQSGYHEILKHWTFVKEAQGLPRAYKGATGVGRAKAFYFLPRTALILLESSPRRSYQFPRGFTLRHIYQDLVRHWSKDSSDDPIFQILEILGMRDYLGIQLPDAVRDKVIKVCLPDLYAIPDDADDVPLVAWEVFNDANEGLNVERWQDWYDLVQPNACPSLRPGNSNLTVQEDAAELFDDFSWDIDHSGEVSKSIQMSPHTQPRIHHIVPRDDNKTACLRGGVGGDPSESGGAGRAEVDAQRCISPKRHLYHRLPEDNFSAHWPQQYVTAGPGQIDILEKCQKHPGKRHLVAKEVPAHRCCVRCDFPNHRLYRPAQVS